MWWVKIYARRWLGKYLGEIPTERAQFYMNSNRMLYFLFSSLFLASMWRNGNLDTKKDTKQELTEYARSLADSEAKRGNVFNFVIGRDTYERYELDEKEYLAYLKDKESARKDTQEKILLTIDHPDLDDELLESLD